MWTNTKLPLCESCSCILFIDVSQGFQIGAHSVRIMPPEPPPSRSREAGVSGPMPPGPISMLSARSSPSAHTWNLQPDSSHLCGLVKHRRLRIEQPSRQSMS
jgi:hypothetical protein